MSLLDRISIDPEIVHGRPDVRSTRMRVTDVLSLLAANADEAEILQDFPYLLEMAPVRRIDLIKRSRLDAGAGWALS